MLSTSYSWIQVRDCIYLSMPQTKIPTFNLSVCGTLSQFHYPQSLTFNRFIQMQYEIKRHYRKFSVRDYPLRLFVLRADYFASRLRQNLMRACSFFLPTLYDVDSASNSSCFLKTAKGANLDSFLFSLYERTFIQNETLGNVFHFI